MARYTAIIWGLPSLPFAFPAAGFEDKPFSALMDALEDEGVEFAYESEPRWLGAMVAASNGRRGHSQIGLTAFAFTSVGEHFASQVLAAHSAWDRARPLINAYCGADPGPGELVLAVDSE